MTDAELLALFAQRDERAIDAVQERYGAYCMSVAARLLPRQSDREECLNDVWHRAWQTLAYRQPNSLRLYLAAITRNLALNLRDRQQAEKRCGAELDLVFEELGECVSGGEGPEDALLARALSDEINRFLHSLPPRKRDIFLRRYYFTESTAQIAARYQMREGNVLTILSRTRAKLRAHLEKEGYFE